MFLDGASTRMLPVSFPRARGDVPSGYKQPCKKWWFSPRTRGCSRLFHLPTNLDNVFPAHAGMFLVRSCVPMRNRCFPRARGDVPGIWLCLLDEAGFSPRTRGCSRVSKAKDFRGNVFPAHAGMFPDETSEHRDWPGFPRARGDVPFRYDFFPDSSAFSPRTRGCSQLVSCNPAAQGVFPAHAGMFPDKAGKR